MNILIAVAINDIIIILAYIIIRTVKNRHQKNAAEEEIISMVNVGHEQGYIEDNEATMINNIFEFGDKQARDIMTDRSNIVGIDGSSKLSDALNMMLNESNSRFPVYEDDLDHIIGILHLKDAVKYSKVKGNATKRIDSIDGLMREARCIPQTRKVDTLFSTMQSTKLQMVIVVDEYGQTSGLVAMEDILEEIVGNILDEYDDDGHITEHGNDTYIIEGKTPLEDLEKKLGVEFNETEFETINGYMISQMEHIPDKKERFDIDIGEYNFKVLEVDHNMITQILVKKNDEPLQNE